MFLPNKLFMLELQRNVCLKTFMKYRSSFRKFVNHNLRKRFLENCDKADIVPIFLKFRIPNNGCFDDRYVRDLSRHINWRNIINGYVE